MQAFRPASQSRSSNSTITAVPGIRVGHHTLSERPTGCTVVLVDGDAVGGVSQRGGAPGHPRNRSARSAEHRRQGERRRAVGRQRVRPRCRVRSRSLARRARHRLADRAPDECRSSPAPSCSTWRRREPEDPSDRRLRLSRGAERHRPPGPGGQHRRRSRSDGREVRRRTTDESRHRFSLRSRCRTAWLSRPSSP